MSNTYYGVRNGRVHYPDEIMNALACSGHNGGRSQIIVERERECKQLNNRLGKDQSSRVYSSNGLSITLNARGNNGYYTLSDEDDKQVRELIRKKKDKKGLEDSKVEPERNNL